MRLPAPPAARKTPAAVSDDREVGRARCGLVGVLGDDDEAHAVGRPAGPLGTGTDASTGAPTTSTRSCAARTSRSRRPVGGEVTGVVAGGPAGTRRVPRTPPATPGQPSRSTSRTRPAQVPSSSAPAPTTRAGLAACSRSRATLATVRSSTSAGRRAAGRRPATGQRRRPAPPSRRSGLRQARVLGRWPPVRRAGERRPARPAGGDGVSVDTGYSPARPSSRPVRKGSRTR